MHKLPSFCVRMYDRIILYSKYIICIQYNMALPLEISLYKTYIPRRLRSAHDFFFVAPIVEEYITMYAYCINIICIYIRLELLWNTRTLCRGVRPEHTLQWSLYKKKKNFKIIINHRLFTLQTFKSLLPRTYSPSETAVCKTSTWAYTFNYVPILNTTRVASKIFPIQFT